MIELHKLQPHEIDELAANARAILGNPAFKTAQEDIQQTVLETLKQEQVGSSAALAAHASMKALGDIEARLTSYITNARVAQSPRRR